MAPVWQVDPRLNRLLLHLYRCVQQPDQWRGFLKHLALSAGADSISMRWVGRGDMELRHTLARLYQLSAAESRVVQGLMFEEALSRVRLPA